MTTVGAIPVTTAARTLFDIAADVAAGVVEEALDDALRRGIVSLPRLQWRLDELGRKGRPGIATMRSLLADRGGSAVPQSVFETKLLRLLTRSGLPQPVTQHHVKERGRLVAVVDFAFPSARVAVEADGYRWHSGHRRWARDVARRNALTSLGWRVIHVTWNDLTSRPQHILRSVEALVSARHEPAVQAPSGRAVQAPSGRAVQAPSGRAVQVPSGRAVQVPSGRAVQVPSGRAVQVPSGRAVQVPSKAASKP